LPLGLLLALRPRGGARFRLVAQFERITYRPLSPKTTIETLAIAWRRERSNAPAVRAFVEHVRDARLSFVV
jgi:DNA-binding transcriptional LysR family regulator